MTKKVAFVQPLLVLGYTERCDDTGVVCEDHLGIVMATEIVEDYIGYILASGVVLEPS